MASISVTDYDFEEQRYSRTLPNRVIEAFQPVAFAKVGYPVRISQDYSLVRYVDSLHELRFEEWLDEMLLNITEEECSLAQYVLTRIKDFTFQRFGQTLLPRGVLMHALHVYRHLGFIFGDSKLRVFEFGPGSGALGACLIAAGHSYAATDVSQAYYIYQNQLWNYLCQGNLHEGVLSGTPVENLARTAPSSAGHIPWWKFVELHPATVPAFDVVMANHAICEFHDSSLRFSLRVVAGMLKKSTNPRSAFIFQGWGNSDDHRRAAVTRMFYDAGFCLIHHDSGIVMFALQETPAGAGGLRYDPSMALFPVPPIHHPPENSLSTAVLRGRAALEGKKTVQRSQVESIYKSLLNGELRLNVDESFWNMIGFRQGTMQTPYT